MPAHRMSSWATQERSLSWSPVSVFTASILCGSVMGALSLSADSSQTGSRRCCLELLQSHAYLPGQKCPCSSSSGELQLRSRWLQQQALLPSYKALDIVNRGRKVNAKGFSDASLELVERRRWNSTKKAIRAWTKAVYLALDDAKELLNAVSDQTWMQALQERCRYPRMRTYRWRL